MTSQEVTRDISRRILPQLPNLIVDVKEPECTLDIELRDDGHAYLFVGQEYGMGGFPAGTAGKGLLLLSGGIDSPVAGYLAMKKGLELELIHFESTPLTSIEAAQKAVDLAAILAKYAPDNRLRLHMIPFEPLHAKLLEVIPESYTITIMRRMMYRIATRLAEARKLDLLVNGESLGQVASQTVESMKTISLSTDALILRPLVTYDKNDIIKIAREIGTFEVSNRPFEDCCAIYVPKSPVIRPDAAFASMLERKADFEPFLAQCVQNVNTVVVKAGSPIDLPGRGVTVTQALS
jgi:thiamine biosynthesis protein ThiI